MVRLKQKRQSTWTWKQLCRKRNGQDNSFILESFADLESLQSHLGPNSRIEFVCKSKPNIGCDKFGFPTTDGQVSYSCLLLPSLTAKFCRLSSESYEASRWRSIGTCPIHRQHLRAALCHRMAASSIQVLLRIYTSLGSEVLQEERVFLGF